MQLHDAVVPSAGTIILRAYGSLAKSFRSFKLSNAQKGGDSRLRAGRPLEITGNGPFERLHPNSSAMRHFSDVAERADDARCLRDSVAKLQKCRAIIFPKMKQTSRNRRP